MEDCIDVTDENGNPLTNINELEYVNGFIWANIFMKNDIVKIDASTGQVVKRIDMSSLYDAEMKHLEAKNSGGFYDYNNNVLNGIAYDRANDVFYLTGKRWDLMFKLRIEN